MQDVKQIIVVRKDLNMRRGKESAQVAHASMKVFFDRMKVPISSMTDYPYYETDFTNEMKDWMNGLFKKVVVSCDSEKELLSLQYEADGLVIPNALILDSGLTEFKNDCDLCNGGGSVIDDMSYFLKRKVECFKCNGTGKINKPTYTCIAIGPDYSDKIDIITGHLKLR